MALELRVHRTPRASLPGDGDPRSFLVVQVERALSRGSLGLAGVVVRPGALELIDLAVARDLPGGPDALLAGLCTTSTPDGDVEAVGVWGRMRRRMADREQVVATVFLERPDCSWWHWSAPLTGDALALDAVEERSAEEGDRLPDGLGRWWTTARRRRLAMRLTPVAATVH